MSTATPQAAPLRAAQRQALEAWLAAAPCALPLMLSPEGASASPVPMIPAEYLDNAAAAAWLGVSAERLRQSRSTGELAGVPAPEFLRLGTRGRVRYRLSTLRTWIERHATPCVPRDLAAAAGQ